MWRHVPAALRAVRGHEEATGPVLAFAYRSQRVSARGLPVIDHSASAPRLARFGIFELDLRSGELRKAGARLNLPDQPLQCLTALLERPGQLVTRDELRQRLWLVDTFVDVEHGLNAAVKRLRDTLGDSADTPR
jgi:DNA-binding response OmpR family regulator